MREEMRDLKELTRDLIEAVKAGQTIEVDRRVFGKVVKETYDENERTSGVRIKPRGSLA